MYGLLRGNLWTEALHDFGAYLVLVSATIIGASWTGWAGLRAWVPAVIAVATIMLLCGIMQHLAFGGAISEGVRLPGKATGLNAMSVVMAVYVMGAYTLAWRSAGVTALIVGSLACA